MLFLKVLIVDSTALFLTDFLKDNILGVLSSDTSKFLRIKRNCNYITNLCLFCYLLCIIKADLNLWIHNIICKLDYFFIGIAFEVAVYSVNFNSDIVNFSKIILACCNKRILNCIKQRILADVLLLF